MKTTVKADSRIIIALDTPSLDFVKKILEDLEGAVSYYKIGFELFSAHGWKAVNLVQKSGARVFLDMKLHDIPNTVAQTAAVICEHEEVAMFNVHTLGGLEMMKKTRQMVDERVKDIRKRPLILGVTILTSHSQEQLKADLGMVRTLRDQVLHLAQLARKAGLDGVVCSPQEIEMLRQELPSDFVIVTPGIRPEESSKGRGGVAQDDQKRVLTPREALAAGASFIVIGRPVTQAPQPRKEVDSILKSLQ